MRHVLIVSVFFILVSATLGFSQTCVDGINQTTGENCSNVVTTALPFLTMPVNPEAAAMGGSGIAISPSTTSIALNSSNLAFIDSKFGVQVSYAPWLRQLGLRDVYLGTAAGYVRLGETTSLGASFRFFNLGRILYTDQNGASIGSFNPREWEGLLSYNRKLSPNFAMGLSLKYLSSKLASGQTVNGNSIIPLRTGAGDLSFTFRKPLKVGDKKATFITGLAIRNIGPKVTYIKDGFRGGFLPTNLGLGFGFVHEFAKKHTLTITGELNRLLVPSPSTVNTEGSPEYLDFTEKSVVEGMFSSFGDAPGGLGEDFRENQYSLGVEYRYRFIIGRLGHFNEHKTKGDRKLITGGIGIRGKGFGIDLSYVTHTSKGLGETYRVSVLYNFEPLKEKEIVW